MRSRASRPGSIDSPKKVIDLMRVTGLGRDTVRACIRSGELPGYRAGRQYVVPAEAFQAFCRGEWIPQHRPIFTEPVRAIDPIRRITPGEQREQAS